MTTKIVYVLTSCETDFYLEQAMISIYSLRLHNPHAIILLVTDRDSSKTFTGNRSKIHDLVSEIVVIDIPSQYTTMQKSRFLKTTLRKHIKGDYLYIDTDTIISDDISEIDNFNCDIGAVIDKHLKLSDHTSEKSIRELAKKVGWKIPHNELYFNSGVMFVKDTPISHKLYDEWYRVWENGIKNLSISIDQPSLAKANELTGYPIKELDGIYNCQIIENGLKYLVNAKVIHYYASNIGKWDSPYIFRNKSIYKSVRENGIDECLKKQIENAKLAFNEKTLILAGNMCEAYYSTISGIARRIFIKMPFLNEIIDRLYTLMK